MRRLTVALTGNGDCAPWAARRDQEVVAVKVLSVSGTWPFMLEPSYSSPFSTGWSSTRM